MQSILLAYINWNPDPYIFKIGGFGLKWYGAMWALAIILSYFLTLWLCRKRHIPTRNVVTAIQYVVIGGLIGARMGQVLFYEPAYYLAHPLEVLMIWNGGLASHGGAIGVLIAAYLFCKRYKDLTYLQMLDILSIVILLSGALIRIGNLFNSEIIGKVTHVSWAFIFEQVSLSPRHPSQLYEAIMVMMVFRLLIVLYIKLPELKSGIITGMFFSIAFALRTLLEFLKEDAFVTQLLNIPVIIAGIILLVYLGKDGFTTVPKNAIGQ